ncbi:alkaline phosphatase family protein [Rhodococcus rhodnii]|uniref:Phosphodiesterase n=2 Tax=Rhodococcus rhodnii TaxID=38312 RepID=R7WND4_9NOCA|nr:alkaline phosphatase family protein [Rhodococcus rhodnii]EOM76803.1 phosphodiesterase [Rhodococcus rhodnii LMG 5362]TXG90024.1 alkaline phosphatase family protein [Rhodococcus rhodnii]
MPTALDVYSGPTLANVLPAALAGLGASGEHDPWGLPRCSAWVVLLVDGLGWNLLQDSLSEAPALGELTGVPTPAGFPTTTATSLTTLGTGLPSGLHGVTGYRSFVPEIDDTVGWLSWRSGRSGNDLRETVVPERTQPHPTVFERAVRAGIPATAVLPASFEGSGLTRAALRGARFAPRHAHGDMIAHTVVAAAEGGLVYCYISEVDTLGHVYGPGSLAWRSELAEVGAAVDVLLRELPRGTGLLVTADHGMVTVPESARIDADHDDTLRSGVHTLAGEPRCRHVHTEPGRTDDVAARWRDRLGDDWHILTRAEAIASGLFGPTVAPDVAGRIGDLVVVARGGGGIVRSRAEPHLSELVGQHGALTDDELAVPVLHTVT